MIRDFSCGLFRNGCITNYVYTPDGQKLQAKYTTPVSYITQSMGQPFTLTSSEIRSVTTTDYWMEGKFGYLPLNYLLNKSTKAKDAQLRHS